MIYHQVAVDVPLDKLFTYRYHSRLSKGQRVLVSFRRKTVVAIVWGSSELPEIDEDKILDIQQVFDEPLLPEQFLDMLAFTARYYHYPIGQTIFTALPQGMRSNRVVVLPPPILQYRATDLGKQQCHIPAHQRKILSLWQMLEAGLVDSVAAKKLHGHAEKYLTLWREKEWVEVVESDGCVGDAPYTLNVEQQQAVDTVKASLSSFKTFLLYGITGSGKTEVYFEVMASVLKQGRQVLFLLPEINLTPQLVQRVSDRFPQISQVVLHSQTTAVKRTQGYLQAQLGRVNLVVGTRLSVFTPLPNLGLIVVDEEHDGSFKQDNELRYHARDLAVWRAKQMSCPIILGSATPSLESWYKVKQGYYHLLQLCHRAKPEAQLPEIQLIDIRRSMLQEGLSPQALTLLQENWQQGGMSVVYLNRRGFAPALFCSDCGYVFSCPNCSAKMVLHQRSQQLRCHHCDFHQAIPLQCSDCGNHDLSAVGFGTQRVEEALRRWLPEASVMRIDRDSMSAKGEWNKLRQTIDEGLVDILVGTQMLAKGHDFGRLNLVIVLNADGSLYSSDFRAPERLFAELIQISGRSGRANLSGRVFIQTRLPNHALFTQLLEHNYTYFADTELMARQSMGLAPYVYIAAIRFDAPNQMQALELINMVMEQLIEHIKLPESVQILGPVPMLLSKLAGRERVQVFLESANRRELHHALTVWQQLLYHMQKSFHSVHWSIDVDPYEM